ncbi:hypothetical protein PV08_07748 [Exophiala spinifera]|uniref:NB-ARC domain-containing protein n=1 Tax=Exophiala spinifera TaxID=91928 RepID=A0A0D1YJ46_9EURO|nr:uncharacterized protein PV08_07748 [Exophiala spinifera]KIW14961.1 hypothetical protein PV08_07748 [Exophiala spinifera]
MVEAARRVCAEDEIEAESLYVLNPGNDLLQDLVDDFQGHVWSRMGHARIACFYELERSDIGAVVGNQTRKQADSPVTQALVVNKQSGCLDVSDRIAKYPLQRTHFTMNKFAQATERDYKLISKVIQDMAQDDQVGLEAQAQQITTNSSIPVITTYERAQRRCVNYFQGRKDQLKQIRDFFAKAPRDQKRVLILQGMGGQGKTQTALKYCKESGSIYSNVFWINANSIDMAVQSMERVAEEIGLEISTGDKSLGTISIVVKELEGRRDRWLMVLDNYDDPTGFREIEEFMPHGGQGDILVTSRYKGLQELGKTGLKDKKGITKSVHSQPGKMPFQQLEGIDVPREDIEHFLTVSAFLQPNHIGESLFRHCLEGKDKPPNWIRIFATIENDHSEPDADSESSNVPAQAKPSWQQERFWKIIKKMHSLSLLDSIGEGVWGEMYLSFHPVICDWLQLRISSESARRFVLEAANIVAVSIFSIRPESEAFSQSRSILLGHVEKCLANDRNFSSHGGNIGQTIEGANAASYFALFCHRYGRYSVSEELCRRIVTLMATDGTFDLLDRLQWMKLLGTSVADQGRHDEAEEIYREIVSKTEKILGPERPETLSSLNDLAVSLTSLGNYEEAEAIVHKILSVKKTGGGRQHQDTLIVEFNVAQLVAQQGRYAEAEKLYRELLASPVKLQRSDHEPGAMTELAVILHHQGKYTEAEELLREAWPLRAKVLGKDHPSTVQTMNNLAASLFEQGKYGEAEKLIREVLTLRGKVLGEGHRDTIKSMNDLGCVLARSSRFEEATVLFERAVSGAELVLGSDHPHTISYRSSFALMQQGT